MTWGMDNLAVKAPSAHQSRVQEVCAVGGGDKDNADVGGEAIHLREELVERLLALLVGPHAGLGTPGSASGDCRSAFAQGMRHAGGGKQG